MRRNKHFILDTSNQQGHKLETDRQLPRITTYRSRHARAKNSIGNSTWYIMPGFQPKITRHTKRPKIQSEETKIQFDLDMAGMLE